MSKIGHNNPPPDLPEDVKNARDYFRFLVRFSPVNTTAKAVGHELACCMNEDGFCWPSGKELMANTGIKDERTMTEVLRVIEREIGLAIERKNGAKSKFFAPKPPTLNAYGQQEKPPASNVGGLKAPALNGGGSEIQPHASNGDAFTQPPASNAPGLEREGGDYRGGRDRLSVTSIDLTKTIDQTQENGQNKNFDRSLAEKKSSPEKPKPKRWTQAQIDTEFDKFWNECPRKIGKVKSREKFELLIREKVKRGKLIEAKVTPEELTSAMASFAARHDDEDVKFVPHPTTWLNQERWVDEREAEKKTSTAWGWWRDVAGMDSLSLEDWRETIRQCKPNGTWPWEKLGPPPGHCECLMPQEAQAAYGDKYKAQNDDLIKEYGSNT